MQRTNARKIGSSKRRISYRGRRFTLSLVLALSFATAGCTPGEIENALGGLEQSFDAGGLEGVLESVAYTAIPYVGMALGFGL